MQVKGTPARGPEDGEIGARCTSSTTRPLEELRGVAVARRVEAVPSITRGDRACFGCRHEKLAKRCVGAGRIGDCIVF
jgi:hypothetical protein